MAVQNTSVVRVNFLEDENGVWAIVESAPIKEFARTKEAALEKVCAAIEAYYDGRVENVELHIASRAAVPGQTVPKVPKARLRELAKKRPPPQSWHEEDLSDLV